MSLPYAIRFFGNSFKGTDIVPGAASDDQTHLGKVLHFADYQQQVFFHTSVMDDKCIAVLELVAAGMYSHTLGALQQQHCQEVA